MDLIQNFFGNRRGNISDPLSILMDPFVTLPFPSFIPNILPSIGPNFPSPVPDPDPPRVFESLEVLNTRLEWNEWPLAHVFKVDVPGANMDEVKVQVHKGRLQISGERSSGKFLHRFWLSEDPKLDAVTAEINEEELLTVTVLKVGDDSVS